MFKDLRFKLFNYILAKEGGRRFVCFRLLSWLLLFLLNILLLLFFLAFDLLHPLFFLIGSGEDDNVVSSLFSLPSLASFFLFFFLPTPYFSFMTITMRLFLLEEVALEARRILKLLLKRDKNLSLELCLKEKGWEEQLISLIILQELLGLNIFLKIGYQRLVESRMVKENYIYLKDRLDSFVGSGRLRMKNDPNTIYLAVLLPNYFCLLSLTTFKSLFKLLNIPFITINVFLISSAIILASFFCTAIYLYFKRKRQIKLFKESARLRFFTKVDSLYMLQANGEDVSKDLEFYLILRGSLRRILPRKVRREMIIKF